MQRAEKEQTAAHPADGPWRATRFAIAACLVASLAATAAAQDGVWVRTKVTTARTDKPTATFAPGSLSPGAAFVVRSPVSLTVHGTRGESLVLDQQAKTLRSGRPSSSEKSIGSACSGIPSNAYALLRIGRPCYQMRPAVPWGR